MGFNLQPGVARADALGALLAFVFGELNCLHLELADPYLSYQDLEGFGFAVPTGTTFVSDLSLSENELFARMDSACRRCIRKSVKAGVTVEEAAPEEFTDAYYTQRTCLPSRTLSLPMYARERVASLIHHVYPSGDLLLLRAQGEVRGSKGRHLAVCTTCLVVPLSEPTICAESKKHDEMPA